MGRSEGEELGTCGSRASLETSPHPICYRTSRFRLFEIGQDMDSRRKGEPLAR